MKPFRPGFSQAGGLTLSYDEYARTRATGQHRTSLFLRKNARVCSKIEKCSLPLLCVFVLETKLSGLNKERERKSAHNLFLLFIYFGFVQEKIIKSSNLLILRARFECTWYFCATHSAEFLNPDAAAVALWLPREVNILFRSNKARSFQMKRRFISPCDNQV